MWLFSRVFIVLEIQSVFRISFGDRFGENIKYLIYRRWFGVDSVIEFGESKENPRNCSGGSPCDRDQQLQLQSEIDMYRAI